MESIAELHGPVNKHILGHVDSVSQRCDWNFNTVLFFIDANLLSDDAAILLRCWEHTKRELQPCKGNLNLPNVNKLNMVWMVLQLTFSSMANWISAVIAWIFYFSSSNCHSQAICSFVFYYTIIMLSALQQANISEVVPLICEWIKSNIQ